MHSLNRVSVYWHALHRGGTFLLDLITFNNFHPEVSGTPPVLAHPRVLSLPLHRLTTVQVPMPCKALCTRQAILPDCIRLCKRHLLYLTLRVPWAASQVSPEPVRPAGMMHCSCGLMSAAQQRFGLMQAPCITVSAQTHLRPALSGHHASYCAELEQHTSIAADQ